LSGLQKDRSEVDWVYAYSVTDWTDLDCDRSKVCRSLRRLCVFAIAFVGFAAKTAENSQKTAAATAAVIRF
jgi:hypothetical protein